MAREDLESILPIWMAFVPSFLAHVSEALSNSVQGDEAFEELVGGQPADHGLWCELLALFIDYVDGHTESDDGVPRLSERA